MTKVRNKVLLSSKRVSLNLVTYPQGHSVLRHNDPMGSGRYFKLNIVLKKASEGGEFRADKVIFKLFNRVFLFRPDIYSHSVTKIEQGHRKLLSLALHLPD